MVRKIFTGICLNSEKPRPILTRCHPVRTSIKPPKTSYRQTNDVCRRCHQVLHLLQSHRLLQERRQTQTQLTIQFIISCLQTKPPFSSYFQVSEGVELLRRNDVAVSHSHCICIAHVPALRVSSCLRLDL